MKGDIYPSESHTFLDEKTGARLRRVTSHPSIHHHPFYYLPAYDDAMRRLIFISHRLGSPQIFAEDRGRRVFVQLTDIPGLDEWSVHPSHDGEYVYFTTQSGAWRVHCETQTQEELIHFDEAIYRGPEMVGAAMGTTTLSSDDRWWAVPVMMEDRSRLYVIHTSNGGHDMILERDTIGHPQFHPDDSSLLRYAGPYDARLWVINRDGSDNRLVYERHKDRKQWIVHETWMPRTRDILTTDWPHGVIGINIDTGRVRQVCTFNAWHAMVNRAGTLMVADTTYPDVGLQLFDPLHAVKDDNLPLLLCESLATNEGSHWDTNHCPYDDGPIEVYAPQHTHPHPNFAPDDSVVVFTSDRSGHAQVYEVEIEQVVRRAFPAQSRDRMEVATDSARGVSDIEAKSP